MAIGISERLFPLVYLVTMGRIPADADLAGSDTRIGP